MACFKNIVIESFLYITYREGDMHEAVLYETLENKKVRCTACKHYCTIPPNHTGICGVRMNKEGKLYLLVYGKSSGMNIDPVEKKPLFHFLPSTPIFSFGTVGCNFACQFCQNWEISQVTKVMKAKLLKEKMLGRMELEVSTLGYELEPKNIVEYCKSHHIPSIAYTYNEPVIFAEYVHDTAELARKEGIKNVMVTSGYESDEALGFLGNLIDAMNIDLKGFTEEFYSKICKTHLQPVLETIRHVHKRGIWMEITTLIIPGKNDSEQELANLAGFIASVSKNIPWHVTAFHPEYKMLDVPRTSHDTLIRAHTIGKKAGLRFVYMGNVHDDKRQNTYCPGCNTLLIRRNWHTSIVEQAFKKGRCQECGESMPGIWVSSF